MFDLSFGELLVVALVALVVVGPRELPRLLRSLGKGIARLRNMSRDLRANSGIDDMIRDEGLDEDLRTLRSLSKARVVDAIINEAAAGSPRKPRSASATGERANRPEDPYGAQPTDAAETPVAASRRPPAMDGAQADRPEAREPAAWAGNGGGESSALPADPSTDARGSEPKDGAPPHLARAEDRATEGPVERERLGRPVPTARSAASDDAPEAGDVRAQDRDEGEPAP